MAVFVSSQPAVTFQQTVHIKSASNFPAPIGGKITLLADTGYLIDGIIEVSDEFIFPTTGSVVFIGLGTGQNILRYTGGATMFEQTARVSGAISLWNCSFQGEGTATMWNVGGAVSELFWTSCDISEFASLGSMNIGSFSENFSSIFDFDAPLDLTFTSDAFIVSAIFDPNTPSDCVILRPGEGTIFQIALNTPFLSSGDNFLNIPVTANTFKGTVFGNLIGNGGQLFKPGGLNHTDPRINAQINPGFANSEIVSAMVLPINVASQALTNGVPVLMNNTFVTPDNISLQRFELVGGNRQKYIGLEEVDLKITGGMSALSDAGTNKETHFFLKVGNETENVITAYADSAGDPGVDTTVTSEAHGRMVGQRVDIQNSTNYNGVHTVTLIVDVDNYDIDTAFIADDAAGDWGILLEQWLSKGFLDNATASNIQIEAVVDLITDSYYEPFVEAIGGNHGIVPSAVKFSTLK